MWNVFMVGSLSIIPLMWGNRCEKPSGTLPPLVDCCWAATKPIAWIQVKFQKSSHPLVKINVLRPRGKQARFAPLACSIGFSQAMNNDAVIIPRENVFQ
jgi:hypothetical protein